MIEQKFIEKGIKKAEMEAYLNSALDRADYSHADIKRTPLNTRIIIYAGRPGVVIGHAGSKINEMTRTLKTQFGVDNPQIEVKSIDNPNTDATVVAKQVASALERGNKHRQIVNIMLKKIMESGAIGVEIEVSGKISGSRSRNEKFMRGYLKKCGNTSEVHTETAQAKAVLKAGALGIKVKIMKTMPDVLSIDKRIKERIQEKDKKDQKAEEPKEPKADADKEQAEPKADVKEKEEVTEKPKAKKTSKPAKKEKVTDKKKEEKEAPAEDNENKDEPKTEEKKEKKSSKKEKKEE